MRLSRLSDRQLRRLIRNADVQFAEDDYRKLTDRFNKAYHRMFENYDIMLNTLWKIQKVAKKNKNDKLYTLLKQMEDRLKKWAASFLQVGPLWYTIQNNPDPIDKK